MADQQFRGPINGGSGTSVPFTAGITGAQRIQHAHARYMEPVRIGNVYYLNVTAGAATAFTGGAAGTPLIALYNPASSGKYASILGVMVASRVAASAAGTAGFNLWGGVSNQPTGTQTAPRNINSLSQAGSSMLGFSNAALTGSTAINQIMPVATYYWATAASALLSPVWVDLGGLVTVQPGNLVALGATAALTSATYDATLVYEELPLLS
jgi:hypothetical protein